LSNNSASIPRDFCSCSFETVSGRRRRKIPSSTWTFGVVALEEENRASADPRMSASGWCGWEVHRGRRARSPDSRLPDCPAAPCELTVRTSGLSMPIPKAMVATITSMRPLQELLLHALPAFGIQSRMVRTRSENACRVESPARVACARVGAYTIAGAPFLLHQKFERQFRARGRRRLHHLHRQIVAAKALNEASWRRQFPIASRCRSGRWASPWR